MDFLGKHIWEYVWIKFEYRCQVYSLAKYDFRFYCSYFWLSFRKSSGVSHSDGSCVLGRIHSDVSSNIPKKVYHIVTDNFVNLLHISYAWLYKTECWRRKFHAFSFNSHRNCNIFMTNFNFIFDTICVPYIFRKSIFGWNCDHDTPLCDTPLLEDTPLCDTPVEICNTNAYWVKTYLRKSLDRCTALMNIRPSKQWWCKLVVLLKRMIHFKADDENKNLAVQSAPDIDSLFLSVFDIELIK